MVTSAIIVSHGQPSDPDPAELDLGILAAHVAAFMPGWDVKSATLAKPGALDDAFADVSGTPFIYPLFMTDGWFVKSALPKRIGDAPACILPPLGVESELPDLVVQHLVQVLDERKWLADETELLVASHGSGRSPKSKEATEAFVTALRGRITFSDVKAGYVEEAPFFGDVAKGGSSQALCLPFFAAYGGHVKEDITDALNAADFEGPLLDPIGTFSTIPGFIASSIMAASEALAAE